MTAIILWLAIFWMTVSADYMKNDISFMEGCVCCDDTFSFPYEVGRNLN